jgi:uncharacterized protein (TIGR02145 family)
MQQMTQAYCASMTVYNGINTTALLTLSDTRGGSYTVGKLADGNCWMLDNLKLGSTTGTMALTSNDTDLHTASNPNITNSSGTLQFTLPQLITSGSSSYDNPGAYGPVTGDTSTGSTNYGYLYNWPAATAGESRTTMPNNSGNAPNSICPAGWHMPTGGSAGEFAWLNAKMNNVAATSPSTNSGTGYYQNFQFNGPFRGVSSGYWFNSFNGQGDSGNFWSSSTYPDNSSIAFRPYFGSSYVHVDDYDSRVVGYSVRCLATGGDSTPVVDFGGTAATVVSYTDTSITVTTPAHAAGKVDVDVSVNGVAAVPSVPTADDYTYVASISITAITPNHGLEAGGTSVTISGANFGASEPTASTTVQEFGTCGASQQVTLPAGTYRLEAWGAQGGYRTSSPNNPNNGGKGGYSAGDIVLTQAQTVQVNVGCSGNNGGWNGGGARTGAPYPGGGGGTDIRIGGTALTDRIVVAGGGGSEGGDDGSYGGYGGGLNGGQGRNYYGQAGTAGTQTAGGTGCTNSGNCTNITSTAGIFGRGGDSGTPQVAGSLIQSGGAGGGGWFGGGGSSGDYSGYDDAAGGAGGSGYVFTTSSNKTGYGANIPNIQYYLSNTSLVAGNTSFAAPGGGNETGHSGDGYVRITPQTTGFFPVVFDTGGTPAPCLVSSWTDTQIVCTTSAHVAGLVSVTITNPNTSATLPAVYTNPSGDLNDPANVSSGFLYQPIYVELQPIASTNLSIAPGSAGSVASSSSQGISTKTNNPTGYSLSLYTTDANSRLANTANSSYYISPVGDGVTTGILSNPIALPANTWGFAIPKTTDGTTPDSALVSNDFDNSYTSVTSQSGYTAKYAKVPTSALTVKNTTSANGELPSNTSIYYAANVDLTRQAGTYKATVVYTVTARP